MYTSVKPKPKSLRKLMAQHKEYARGPKNLFIEHRAKTACKLKVEARSEECECMAKAVVYEENHLKTLVKRVCEWENYVLNLETKYLSKSRGLSIAEIVDNVHCLTRFIRRVKECFC